MIMISYKQACIMFKPAWERWEFSENLPAYKFCTARLEKLIIYTEVEKVSEPRNLVPINFWVQILAESFTKNV